MSSKESRNDLERHVESFVRKLVTEENKPGGFIDIPKLEVPLYEWQGAVALWTGRLIRKPLGNRNGTYKMSDVVRPGFTRITLVDKIP